MLVETNVTKVCNVCNQEKEIGDFYFRKDGGKYNNHCKKCKPLRTKASIISECANRTSKVCKHCGIDKPVSEFGRAGKGKYIQPYCNLCDNIRKKKHLQSTPSSQLAAKVWREENRDAILAKNKEKYNANREIYLQRQKKMNVKHKDKISMRRKEYYRKNADRLKSNAKERRLENHAENLIKEKAYRLNKTDEQKERDKQNRREWQFRNKEVLKDRYKERKRRNRNEWCNNKSATSVEFRILKNLRSRTRFALKKDGAVKSAATEELLGCTIPEFRDYFESLFTDGMTWALFMKAEIHIDHKRPCKEFDLTDPHQQRECFNFRNLQPLYWLHNLQKGTRNFKEWKSQLST